MNKIWLSRYPADVPADIDPDRYASLVDMFEHAVTRYQDCPAFISMGKTITYGELDARSRAFAAYLQQALNLQKGERVALMMPNLLQYPVAFLQFKLILQVGGKCPTTRVQLAEGHRLPHVDEGGPVCIARYRELEHLNQRGIAIGIDIRRDIRRIAG